MRVLYVSHASAYHGAVMSLFQLVKGLDRTRYTPLAAFSKKGAVIDALRERGVDARVLSRRGVLNIGLINEARRLIRDEGIGLVHLNNAVGFCKNVAIAAKLSGAKVVWHVREDPNSARLKRLKPWIRLLADRVMVVSTELEESFRKTGKAVKIYNGVDTDEFSPGVDGAPFRERYGIGKDVFLFGLVGTIEPRKGTMQFVRAAEELIREHPDCGFLLVGSGLPEYEDELKRFLDERPGLRERTFLTGRIKEVPEAMAAMDVLVMPSSWEGFPRAVIEAMSSGRPVLATAVGEVPWIVDDGETGFILPSRDVDALTAAMKRCVGMGGALKAMGMKGREKAVRLYNLEAHVGHVQDEYMKLCGV